LGEVERTHENKLWHNKKQKEKRIDMQGKDNEEKIKLLIDSFGYTKRTSR
jgi:hypothetical protein